MRLPTLHLDAAPVYARIEFTELLKVASRQHEITWEPFREGVEIHRFYGDPDSGPSAALLRFGKAGKVPLHEHEGYEHILVIAGSQRDNNGVASAGSLIINPPGTRHSIVSEAGCIVLAIYEKPVRFLASAQAVAAPKTASDPVELAVNGTLMRGLELNGNLLAAGGRFVREDSTDPAYRLFSINDRHPAMYRVREGGVAVAVEVWAVPPAGLASVLITEPPGLSIGKVRLTHGAEVLGVLGEPILCENQRDISSHGGWRAYCSARAI